MQVRIKHAQIKAIREELLKRSKGLCEICGKRVTKSDGDVLDHDHETGLLRGVVHRSCNTAEGKVRVKARWAHRGVSQTDFLIGLGKYLEKYKQNPRNLLHSSWLSKKERAVMRILK